MPKARANADDQALGRRLRRLRILRDLSQSDVAAAIGVSFQQVQKYERGVNRIPAVMVLPLARLLDVTVGRLLDEPPATCPSGATGQPGAVDIGLDHRELVDLQAALAIFDDRDPALQHYLRAIAALASAIALTDIDPESLATGARQPFRQAVAGAKTPMRTGPVAMSGMGTTWSTIPQSDRSSCDP